MMLNSIIASGYNARRRRVAPQPPAADDWATRSAGAVFAHRLDVGTFLSPTQSNPDQTHWLHPTTADHVSLDTSIYPPGSSASLRFNVLGSDSANAGLVGMYFGHLATFGAGSTLWTSVRYRADELHTVYPWNFSTAANGAKVCILSNRISSNQPNEIVITANTDGQFIAYWQDGFTSAVGPEIGAATACSGSDFRLQPAIDRGANRLTGTDPDTGSAWSACAQDRARYGGLYSAGNLSYPKRGVGDPLSGGFRYAPNEWITFIQRVTIGTFGASTNRITLWAARDGQAPVMIQDKVNIRLGNAPDYDTLWLLPYCTNRASGGKTVTARTNNITGVTILAPGLSTQVGDGTLEYDASTQRFRWAGAGDTFGTARGFSAANGILLLPVASGTVGDSYLIIKINPAALPSVGTVTDTVTVASGRPDTFVNYADVIVSNSIINAPGGFAPVG